MFVQLNDGSIPLDIQALIHQPKTKASTVCKMVPARRMFNFIQEVQGQSGTSKVISLGLQF